MWHIFTTAAHQPVHFTYTPVASALSVSTWFHYPDYTNYYGPSSLAHIFRFIELVNSQAKNKPIIFYCDRFDKQRANTVFLLCAYMVVVMGMGPEEAVNRVHPVVGSVPSFRTEGAFVSEDYCEISDCVRGLHRAKYLGWLDHLYNGDMVVEQVLSQIEDLEDPSHGDISWIIPNKLIAMAGPLKSDDPKAFAGSPDLAVVLKTLKSLNVGCIVRLNRPHYKQSDLPKGIQLVDFFVHDGSVPEGGMIEQLKETVEGQWKKGKAVAVHCRAGLGRTGTFIGTLLMDWFGFTAAEAIAFLRIARPGMVLGDQSLFLKSYESSVIMTVNAKRGKHGPKQPHLKSSCKRIKIK